MPSRDGFLPANHGYPMLALYALTPLPSKAPPPLDLAPEGSASPLGSIHLVCPLSPLLDKNFTKAGTAFSPFYILWAQKLRKLRQLES